ncbi:hypothetical protein HQ531_11675 [bacterium]|nr:hypothetical protein [bacterium]
MLIQKHGLSLYQTIVNIAGLPEIIKYYGVVALIIEFYLATGVWVRKIFTSALTSMFLLTLCGSALSVFFIVFKLNLDCGCGLLGDSEYGLLIQKLVILIVLIILYKNKTILFSTNKPQYEDDKQDKEF